MKNKNKKIQIIPIGGLEEFGKNLTLLQYKNEIIVIDCGLMFPENNLYGVNYVINDYTYLLSNKEKIKAILITHGHLDHIGGLPYLLKSLIPEINPPIYSSDFTRSFLIQYLNEYLDTSKLNTHAFDLKQPFKIGEFLIDPISVNHSIRGAVSYAITTPAGIIIHSGDFKIDRKPLFENQSDIKKFKQYGKKPILALLSDSTNAVSKGHSLSESELTQDLANIISQAKGRIIITTFASQINRLKHIISIAKNLNKKICPIGRSIVNNLKLSFGLDIIDNDNLFIDIKKLHAVSDKKIIVLTTGSQGEPLAALTKMADNTHKFIKLKTEDTVIFSSSNIPGNEKSIIKTINALYKRKIKVFTNKEYDIHASGHAKEQELRELIRILKPEYFIPVHGENIMLYHHAELAKKENIKEEQILFFENGDVVELSSKEAKKLNRLKLKPVYIENSYQNYLTEEIISERKILAENGIIIITVLLNVAEKKFTDNIIINSKGFINRSINQEFFKELKKLISSFYKNFDFHKEQSPKDQKIKQKVSDYIYQKTAKKPLLCFEIY